MRFVPAVLAGLALLSSAAAFARDSSEKIPAPVVELRPAGTLPTATVVVKDSPIPAPTVEVIPAPSVEVAPPTGATPHR